MKKQLNASTGTIVIAVTLLIVVFMAWYTFFKPQSRPSYMPKPGDIPPMPSAPKMPGGAHVPSGQSKASNDLHSESTFSK